MRHSSRGPHPTPASLACFICGSVVVAFLFAPHALSAPGTGAVHEIVAVADPLQPTRVAQWVYGNASFKADEWDKLLGELDKQVKAAPQGTFTLTFVAPPHVHYGKVEPMLKALAAALPDHTIGLAARADPKQAAALKAKDATIVLTPAESAWRPVARIINPPVIDAIKPEPAPAVAPIPFRMRAGEKGTSSQIDVPTEAGNDAGCGSCWFCSAAVSSPASIA